MLGCLILLSKISALGLEKIAHISHWKLSEYIQESARESNLIPHSVEQSKNQKNQNTRKLRIFYEMPEVQPPCMGFFPEMR